MNCPICDEPTKVIDSRSCDDGRVKRRRQCTICGRRFNTVETLIGEIKRRKK